MIRVRDLDAALDFFVNKLGLVETRRKDVPKGRFTLVFLAIPMEPVANDDRLAYVHQDAVGVAVITAA